MYKKQTLVQAVHLALSGKSTALASASQSLDGKPAGGWPETDAARRDIRDQLPVRLLRCYTIDHFISAVYELDSSDRYRTRTQSGAMARAAKIEAESAK
jgi:hypothetical protein